MVESLTGFLASDMKGWRAPAARIAQAALKGELFQQFAREINEIRAAGKIPDNFAVDDRGYQTWVELMTVIDNECPDAERMEAMKAMFFEVNRVRNATDAEKILAYQLFQISKRLTSGELSCFARSIANTRRAGSRAIQATSNRMRCGRGESVAHWGMTSSVSLSITKKVW